MVFVMPIILNITNIANDAKNKIIAKRQCLNAVLIIVMACLFAHLVDRGFYTFKTSSKDANRSVAYFALTFKIGLMASSVIVFVMLYRIVKSETFLLMKQGMYLAHVIIISSYFAFWAAYTITYQFCMADPDFFNNIQDARLLTLAVMELMYNWNLKFS